MKLKVLFAVILATVAVQAQTSNSSAMNSGTTEDAGTSNSLSKASGSPETTIGTSTASAEQKVVETKNWDATVFLQGEATNAAIQRIGESSVVSENYLGATYSFTADNKLGFRQYFNYATAPDQADIVGQSWSVLTFATKVNGIAGSEPIVPLFWYYIPVAKAVQNNLDTNDTVIHGGVLRLDAEVAWTLNPHWTVSYYFNPRQSLISDINYMSRGSATEESKAKYDFAQTTLIHYGYVYYNVNDAVQPYGYVGMDSRASTHDMKSIKDHALLGIGANFTLLGGKLILNPEIYNEVGLKDDYAYASAPQWLQSEDFKYLMTAAVTF